MKMNAACTPVAGCSRAAARRDGPGPYMPGIAACPRGTPALNGEAICPRCCGSGSRCCFGRRAETAHQAAPSRISPSDAGSIQMPVPGQDEAKLKKIATSTAQSTAAAGI